MAGCMKEAVYTPDDLEEILEQNNPKLCLELGDKIVNEDFVKEYIPNLKEYEEKIMFKDICLIYTINQNNINDEFIVLCNEASNIEYTLMEEGSYEIPAWEFCFREAFNDYKSYSQPPRLGNINNQDTCNQLKGFKDNCLYLVAKNNNDISVCDLISSEGRRKMCKEES
tara:strand:- start:27014 stop:27520 length:507 start_codon:yes stop_codon:yes gene_type:complete